MENLVVTSSHNKTERYKALIPQLQSLVESETDTIANFANLVAALKQTFNFFWVGFYIVKNNQLVLGPFQGPIACTRIDLGKGVCGKAWKEKQTIIVPDVEQFPGHIACNQASKSEIVLPGFYQNEVIFVLDIDSEKLDHFDDTDNMYLTQIVKIIEGSIHHPFEN